MKAYRVSKETTQETLEEKVELIKSYSVGDLLYVLREYENSPSRYDKEVIEEVARQLYNNNIVCM